MHRRASTGSEGVSGDGPAHAIYNADWISFGLIKALGAMQNNDEPI
jgi:hypothetical protein